MYPSESLTVERKLAVLQWESRIDDKDREPVSALAYALHNFLEFSKAHLRRIVNYRQVSAVHISPGLKHASHVVVINVYNEAHRIDAFLAHYRNMGFEQFIVLDNRSTDSLRSRLQDEAGISYFFADGSFKKARFGCDWINGLLSKYCHDKWILYVDADEFLVFPHSDKKRIDELTAQLTRNGQHSMNSLMVDMYSDRKMAQNTCPPGANPLPVCPLYDRSGYEASFDARTRTTWIKGGVRGRIYFKDIWAGPALNKTPLVHWRRHYAFLKVSHQVWPFHLNEPRPRNGCKISGALLHFKFLADIGAKLSAEAARQQHTAEYAVYMDRHSVERDGPDFVGPPTARFENWSSFALDKLITGSDEMA